MKKEVFAGKLLVFIIIGIVFGIVFTVLLLFVDKKTPNALKDKSAAFYTCPKTEWVNCMPGPGSTNPQCESKYLDWATENCPGFKGPAY